MDFRRLFFIIGSFALISLSECCWGGSSQGTESPIVMEVREKVNEELLNLSRNGTEDFTEDQIGSVSNIYNILETVLGENTTLPTGTQVNIDIGNIAVTLVSLGVKNLTEQGYKFISSTEDSVNSTNSSQPDASIQIPSGGVESSNDTVTDVLVITSVARRNGSEGSIRNGTIDEGEILLYDIVSSIMTVRLFRNGAGRGDVPDINRVIVTIPYENTTKNPAPYYFEEENVNISDGVYRKKLPECDVRNKMRGLQWSSVGCNSQCDEEELICEMNCNHATSFAVLQMLGESKLVTKGGQVASSVLTTIGCVISIISLVTALVIYFLLRSRIATEQYAIHSNLMVSLLISLCVFMTLSMERKSELICRLKQFLLQYFFLATFCWMLCEGIHLYRKIITVFESGTKYLLMYFYIGWVVPLAVVLISIICVTLQESNNQNVFRERKSKPCFFSHEDGSIWYFLVPVLLVIVINTGILVRVNIIVVKAAKLQAGRDSSPAIYQARAGLRSALLLIPLLGCAYILGFLASFHGAFEIMYNIINSLQGFFISLFYCFMNKEIRASIGKFIQRSQEMNSIQASTTGTTGVTLPLRKLYMRNKIEPAEQPAERFQEAPVREDVEEPLRESTEKSPADPAKKLQGELLEELLEESKKEQPPDSFALIKPPKLPTNEPTEKLVKEPEVNIEQKPEEKSPQQHMEIGAEDPVNRPAEIHPEGPLGEPAKESVEEPTEEMVLEPPEATSEEPSLNNEENPGEKSSEQSAPKLPDDPVYSPAKTTCKGPLGKSAKEPVEGPSEEMVLEPAQIPTDMSAEKFAEEPLIIAEEKPGEKPSGQPAAELAEQSVNRLPKMSLEGPLGESAKEPVKEPPEGLVLEPPEIHADMSAEKPLEQPLVNPEEHPAEKLLEQPAVKLEETPLEESSKEPMKDTLEDLALESPELSAVVFAGKFPEESLEGTLEERSQNSMELPGEESIEQPPKENLEKPVSKPPNVPAKRPRKKTTKRRSEKSANNAWY